jgi:LEA14-like dessication related protein
MFGRTIKTYHNNFTALAISGIAKGMYYLQVWAKEGYITKKVTIE